MLYSSEFSLVESELNIPKLPRQHAEAAAAAARQRSAAKPRPSLSSAISVEASVYSGSARVMDKDLSGKVKCKKTYYTTAARKNNMRAGHPQVPVHWNRLESVYELDPAARRLIQPSKRLNFSVGRNVVIKQNHFKDNYPDMLSASESTASCTDAAAAAGFDIFDIDEVFENDVVVETRPSPFAFDSSNSSAIIRQRWTDYQLSLRHYRLDNVTTMMTNVGVTKKANVDEVKSGSTIDTAESDEVSSVSETDSLLAINFGMRAASRRRSSLAIELSVFIAKIISKFLYIFNRVAVERRIEVLTLLTQHAMKRSAAERWDTSNPMVVAARVKIMLSESETRDMVAPYGHSVRDWPTNTADIYPAIADYGTAVGYIDQVTSSVSSRAIDTASGSELNIADIKDMQTLWRDEAQWEASGSEHGPGSQRKLTLQGQLNLVNLLNYRANIVNGEIDELPHPQSRYIRIYVSSGYSDMQDEQTGILRLTLPKLRQMARENNLEVQIVDLHWAMDDDMLLGEPDIVDIVQFEMDRCRAAQTGPFFLSLLGNRYGDYQLPRVMSVEKYDTLLKRADEEVKNQFDLQTLAMITVLYRYDENAVPHVYVLQPISNLIPNFLTMDFGPYGIQMRKGAARRWAMMRKSVANFLDEILQLIADSSGVNPESREAHKHYFFPSLTEKEIEIGMYHRAQYCVCYARNITGIQVNHSEDLAPRYIDTKERSGQTEVDQRKQQRLELLKDSLDTMKVLLTNIGSPTGRGSRFVIPETDLLAKKNMFSLEGLSMDSFRSGLENPLYLQQYNIEWEKFGDETRHMAENRAFITAATDAYVKLLTSDLANDLTELTFEYFNDKHRKLMLLDEFEEEIMNHNVLLKQKMDGFLQSNRVQSMTIRNAMNHALADHKPFIIVGESGVGKSCALTELLGHLLQGGYENEIVVILRYVGATSWSRDLVSILDSIHRQICEAYDIQVEKESDDFHTCQQYFDYILSKATTRLCHEKELYIIIDGLGRLIHDNESKTMRWLPRMLPEFCHIIVTASSFNQVVYNNLMTIFRPMRCVYELRSPDSEDKIEMANALLSHKNRTVTEEQQELLIRALRADVTPLYVTIFMRDVVRWRSFYDTEQIVIHRTVEALIDARLYRLEGRLGKKFVRHAISYLLVTPVALTEIEWEDALACDDSVLSEVFSLINPPQGNVIRCPQMYTARLVYYLRDWLIERNELGIPTYHWAHWTIRSTIDKLYLNTADREPNQLFYHCNQVLTEVFGATDAIEKTFAIQHRKIYMERASRMVDARPLNVHNKRKLIIYPSVLYNSGPEHDIRDEYKRKIICNIQWLLIKLRSCSYKSVLADFDRLVEKDSEVLLLESIFRNCSTVLRKDPELLQLEILSRFSKIPGVNGECIDRLVLQSRSLLLFYEKKFLCPLYPCIEIEDTCLKSQIYGPTHVISVYQCRWAVTWAESIGLQIWDLYPVPQAKYHLSDVVLLCNILPSDDASLVFFTSHGKMEKWNVSTGKQLLIIDLESIIVVRNGLKRPSNEVEPFTPLAVNSASSQIVVRINSKELLVKQSGVILLNALNFTVAGFIGRSLYGLNLTEASIFSDNVFLSYKAFSNKRRAKKNIIFVYRNIPTRDESAFIVLPARAIQVPLKKVLHIDDKYIQVSNNFLASFIDSQQPNGSVDHHLASELSKTARHIVGVEVTDHSLWVILFAYDLRPRGASALLATMSGGEHRGVAVSTQGSASCLSLSLDSSTAFVGYRGTGMIEVYFLPDVELQYRFHAHIGDVCSITEVTLWRLYTTGTDNTMRFFDIGNILSLDFTRKTSFEMDRKRRDAVSESAYEANCNGITQSDVAYRGNTWFKILLCTETCQSPILVDLQSGFTALQLVLPVGIDRATEVRFAADDKRIVGLALENGRRQEVESLKLQRFLVWSTYKLMTFDLALCYTSMMNLSNDRHHAILVRYHTHGCFFAVYRVKNNTFVGQYRSNRRIVHKRDSKLPFLSSVTINASESSTHAMRSNTTLTAIGPDVFYPMAKSTDRSRANSVELTSAKPAAAVLLSDDLRFAVTVEPGWMIVVWCLQKTTDPSHVEEIMKTEVPDFPDPDRKEYDDESLMDDVDFDEMTMEVIGATEEESAADEQISVKPPDPSPPTPDSEPRLSFEDFDAEVHLDSDSEETVDSVESAVLSSTVSGNSRPFFDELLSIGDESAADITSATKDPDHHSSATLWAPMKSRFLLRVFTDPKAVVMSGSGMLYTGSDTGAVIQFNLRAMAQGTTRFYLHLYSHDDAVTCATLSHNGNVLATGSSDGGIKIWNTKNMSLISDLKAHADEVLSVSIGHRGGVLTSGSRDETVCMWDIRTGSLMSRFHTAAHGRDKEESNNTGCPTCDVYKVMMMRAGGDLAHVAALVDSRERRKLILLKPFNMITSNKSENF